MKDEPFLNRPGMNDYIDKVAPTPEWLKASGDEAKQKGLNKLGMEQIDAEITAVRRERRAKGEKGRTPASEPTS